MKAKTDRPNSIAEFSKFALQQDTSILEESQNQIEGTVIAVQANFYQVRLGNGYPRPLLLCTRRTRLKKIGQKIMVGDRVIVVEPDWQDQRGAISQVVSRTSELQRPPVANANQILLVFAVAEPILDPWQLSRFLVKAESTSLNLSLCLNKCDLISRETQQKWQQKLLQWGYQVSLISTQQKMGIDKLKKHLEGKITVVACLLYTSPSPRDLSTSRMPSSA